MHSAVVDIGLWLFTVFLGTHIAAGDPVAERLQQAQRCLAGYPSTIAERSDRTIALFAPRDIGILEPWELCGDPFTVMELLRRCRTSVGSMPSPPPSVDLEALDRVCDAGSRGKLMQWAIHCSGLRTLSKLDDLPVMLARPARAVTVEKSVCSMFLFCSVDELEGYCRSAVIPLRRRQAFCANATRVHAVEQQCAKRWKGLRWDRWVGLMDALTEDLFLPELINISIWYAQVASGCIPASCSVMDSKESTRFRHSMMSFIVETREALYEGHIARAVSAALFSWNSSYDSLGTSEG
jgi:hypothetical protein